MIGASAGSLLSYIWLRAAIAQYRTKPNPSLSATSEIADSSASFIIGKGAGRAPATEAARNGMKSAFRIRLPCRDARDMPELRPNRIRSYLRLLSRLGGGRWHLACPECERLEHNYDGTIRAIYSVVNGRFNSVRDKLRNYFGCKTAVI